MDWEYFSIWRGCQKAWAQGQDTSTVARCAFWKDNNDAIGIVCQYCLQVVQFCFRMWRLLRWEKGSEHGLEEGHWLDQSSVWEGGRENRIENRSQVQCIDRGGAG